MTVRIVISGREARQGKWATRRRGRRRAPAYLPLDPRRPRRPPQRLIKGQKNRGVKVPVQIFPALRPRGIRTQRAAKAATTCSKCLPTPLDYLQAPPRAPQPKGLQKRRSAGKKSADLLASTSSFTSCRVWSAKPLRCLAASQVRRERKKSIHTSKKCINWLIISAPAQKIGSSNGRRCAVANLCMKDSKLPPLLELNIY